MSEPPPPEIIEAIDAFARGDVYECRRRLLDHQRRNRRRTHPSVYYVQGLCDRHEGLLEDAEASLMCALQGDADNPDYALELGQLQIQTGRTALGLATLQRAVTSSGDAPPYRHEFYLQNGAALYAEGQLDAALMSVRKSLRFGASLRSVKLLAEMLLEQGRWEEAVEHLQQQMHDEPSLWTLLAHALQQLDRNDEAEQALQKANRSA